MPYPNTHAARQADPSAFVRVRAGEFDGAPDGISVLYGIREDGGSEVQSIRADAGKVTPEAFRKWLADNDFKTEIEEAEKAVAASAASPVALMEPEDGPKWVEMTRAGMHVSRRVGGKSASGHESVPLTDDDIRSMVRGFALAKGDGFFAGGMAPVGVDHDELEAVVAAAMARKTIPAGAMANYSDVRAEVNDEGGLSLMGLHHYTDVGRSSVRAKALRGYSIDAMPPGLLQTRNGEPITEWVPLGGTLTNTPFVRGMAAVAASEAPKTDAPRVQTNQRENPMTDALNGVLGLSEGASATDQIKAIAALSEQARKVPALEEKVSALSDALDTTTADRDAKTAEVAALSEWKQGRLVEDAVGAGRCSEAESADYLKAVKALGEEHAHRVYPKGRIAVEAIATGDQRGKETGAQSGEEVYGAAYDAAIKDGKDQRTAHDIGMLAARDLINRDLAAEA